MRLTGEGEARVVAPAMHPVRLERERELDAVIDDERNAVGAGQPHQFSGFNETSLGRNRFSPILKQRNAAFQRETHLLDQLLAVDAVGRNGIQPAQLHCSKNLLGMNCPAPGAKPAASACQVNSSASRTASGTEAPLASAAAIAEARVQPEP